MDLAAHNVNEAIAALSKDTANVLNASDSDIGDCGCDRIALALAQNTQLRTLRLSDNGIKDLGASVIAEALQTNHALKTLTLSRNCISHLGAEAIAQMLTINVWEATDIAKPLFREATDVSPDKLIIGIAAGYCLAMC
eukprot:TRINITY_DN19110_c0_g2_i1.p1 TRINITY_DN19110_c0_g2~~TRINITY_DN19110_c0_g2_i1.p1  ORF type:complete len:160 (+),score=22.26 TRINITY_DN19110_c0_g2_i1:68-481(+)